MTTAPGAPDYLDTTGPGDSRDGNRKRLFALGGVIGTVVVIGGGAWAATNFFSTGAQPAEALPASTIAYASVDLNPSGKQKIEAIKTLRKFPAFRENIDLQTDDDIRERLFEEVTKTGECQDLDYDRDILPWLGSRAAIAAVDAGEKYPSPVGVIQVTDPAKAEEGLLHLVSTCGGDGAEAATETGGWVVEGDWVIVAETRDIAESVVDQTEQGTLADDQDYSRWTGEAGDDGIISIYVASEAAEYTDVLSGAGGALLGMGAAPENPFSDDFAEFSSGPDESSDSLSKAIEDFEGMAMTIRFDGGALEIESATSANQDMQQFFESTIGVDLVASLPESTVAALGLGLEEGWLDAVGQQVVDAEGGEVTLEDLYQEASVASGLELPDDLETLLGDGVAVALGDGIDLDGFANGGPTELPIGVKIKGDAEAIQAVLDKIEPQLASDEQGLLELSSSGDHVALSPDDDLRAAMVKGGSLGDNAVFEQVVEGADEAQAVLFVNFNADDDWLVRVADDLDPDLAENFGPLAAFGVSAWFEDGVGHALVKLTTD